MIQSILRFVFILYFLEKSKIKTIKKDKKHINPQNRQNKEQNRQKGN